MRNTHPLRATSGYCIFFWRKRRTAVWDAFVVATSGNPSSLLTRVLLYETALRANYIYIYIFTRIFADSEIYVFVHVLQKKVMYIYICIYTHVYTYIYVHICVTISWYVTLCGNINVLLRWQYLYWMFFFVTCTIILILMQVSFFFYVRSAIRLQIHNHNRYSRTQDWLCPVGLLWTWENLL
jgi:hypothetical protein